VFSPEVATRQVKREEREKPRASDGAWFEWAAGGSHLKNSETPNFDRQQRYIPHAGLIALS